MRDGHFSSPGEVDRNAERRTSSVSDAIHCPHCGKRGQLHDIKRHVKRCLGQAPEREIQNKSENKMLTGKPMIPFVNVEDVPAGAGIPITIADVRETDDRTKKAVENAREFTLEFTSASLDKTKFPEGRATRMFSQDSDMFKKLSALSGQKQQSDGTFPIDESKLPGKKANLIRQKSAGKFSNQDTLTLK